MDIVCYKNLLIAVLCYLLLLSPTRSNAQENDFDIDSLPALNTQDGTEALFDLSLDDLMDIQVITAASITENDPLKTPASVTLITAEDIARTPARNILDLMEIYVPGALYVNHSTGPQPGIRGIVADRPYKFLVTINGININIKAHYGARLELLNWDLNDIKQIEIIRGPGSVTYGPGAIGGVINITTKSAASSEGVKYGGAFWDKYDSIGNYISYGRKTDTTEIYSYLSVVHTNGITPDLYGIDSDAFGYVGEATNLNSNMPAFTYMADFYERPQIKSHFDIRFKKNWRFWGRYSSSSSTLVQGTSTKFLNNGEYIDFRQTQYQYYQFALENNQKFDDEFSLKSTLAFSSTDIHNVEKFDTNYTIDNDKDNLQNIGWIWSEDELFTQFMFKYDNADDLKAAMGFEFSYNTIGPGWGKDPDNGLLLSSGIISGVNSDFYGTGYRQIDDQNDRYYAVGDGWNSYNYAVLGEINSKLLDNTTFILSARVDKHEFTDSMLSPRFATIHQLNNDNYIKLIVQRSVRMNTEDELFMSHQEGEDSDPEELDTLELIYSGNYNTNTTFQTSAFINHADVIAWDWNQLRTAPVGKLKTFGLEFETAYKKDNISCGFNHSFVKQLDWTLNDGVDVSGISYADYNIDLGDDIIMTSNGNDLNNWSNHATKLYSNIDLLNNKVNFHVDLVTFWGFEGCKDGLDALAKAGGYQQAIDDINNKNAYDLELKTNLSLTFRLNENADIILFGQNIPVIGDNKRYGYSSGFKRAYPDKANWIEEPSVFGVKFKAKF